MLTKASSIDLDKYVGVGKPVKERTWHQVAAFPTWFQRDLLGRPFKNVTAVYTPMEGYIEVKNAGTTASGKRKVQKGKAFITEKKNVLAVQFSLLQPRIPNYIIEFVDENYEHAIVGSPNKQYMWILTRGEMTPTIFQELLKIAKRRGYDISRLE